MKQLNQMSVAEILLARIFNLVPTRAINAELDRRANFSQPAKPARIAA